MNDWLYVTAEPPICGMTVHMGEEKKGARGNQTSRQCLSAKYMILIDLLILLDYENFCKLL